MVWVGVTWFNNQYMYTPALYLTYRHASYINLLISPSYKKHKRVFKKMVNWSFKRQKGQPLRNSLRRKTHSHMQAHTNLPTLPLTLHISLFSPSLPHLCVPLAGCGVWHMKGPLCIFAGFFFIHNWFVSHNEGVIRRKLVSGRASLSDMVSK